MDGSPDLPSGPLSGPPPRSPPGPLMTLDRVMRRFGAAAAVDGVSGTLWGGKITGLVGPDGAGKTTLMRLMAGLLLPDGGAVHSDLPPDRGAIGYMPQRFGLYEDLSVSENLALYADLHGLAAADRDARFGDLLHFTGLTPFTGRLAGHLSGGMKQKLGLGCALLSHPRLLLLDEPSVGVDPMSRRELWTMVRDLADRGIGVVWSTAYMDEAERCDTVLLMNEGRMLFDGPPADLTRRVAGRTFALGGLAGDPRAARRAAAGQPGVIDALIQGGEVRIVMDAGHAPPAASAVDAGADAHVLAVPPRFEDAFCALLHAAHDRPRLDIGLLAPSGAEEGGAQAVVEARDLVRRFGAFTAVDGVSFTVARGEIFGLLGPNGAGKSTTFRMLCGLLGASAGTATVAGLDLAEAGPAARQRIGYMSQKFSLYGQLSVRQNLDFFAGAYGLASRDAGRATDRMIDLFGLAPFVDSNAETLAFGYKQRLSLACALMHGPAILFLDEPTSGVDPLTRREFWAHINTLAAAGVTVMVTTHYLDEAEYCDRLGLIYRGRLIAEGRPGALKAAARAAGGPEPSLEDAFIHLVEADDAARQVAP